MKTLYSSCSNTIIPNKNGTSNFCCSRALNLTRHELSSTVLPWKKLVDVGFLHLVCVKHKPFPPFRVHSSLSPESQVDLEITDSEKSERDQSNMVRVRFLLQKGCSFGEQFAIVGNDSLLGSWDPENAILLNWSDGHVWTIEMDMPIGTSIEYKFLLKGIAGDVLWQPGPDRVLETWECSNTIVVSEDWEDAALQNIAEEEGSVIRNEESTIVDNEMLLVSGGNGQPAVSDVYSYHEKEQSVGAPEKSIVADNIAVAKENPLSIIADNMSYTEEVSAENASNQVLGEDNISIVSHVGDPVLVPGLTPLPEKSTEAPVRDECEGEGGTTTSFSTSEGVNDVENYKLPELEVKQDTNGDACQEERINNVNHEEQLATVNDLNHEEQLEKEFEQKQHDPEKRKGEEVFRNDIQWGRKTLQKLLTNFGLL